MISGKLENSLVGGERPFRYQGQGSARYKHKFDTVERKAPVLINQFNNVMNSRFHKS